ncbi:hypothetical protein L0128_07925 [candidate division KSB1 bacterium]|nr:hypothetical protein [candidate division KSB1 bacterium]
MKTDLTLDEIIEDLQAIESKILEYEKKYRLLSVYFYKLYQTGKLEEAWDFQHWAGLYEIKLDREKKYQSKLNEVINGLPLLESVEKNILLKY